MNTRFVPTGTTAMVAMTKKSRRLRFHVAYVLRAVKTVTNRRYTTTRYGKLKGIAYVQISL